MLTYLSWPLKLLTKPERRADIHHTTLTCPVRRQGVMFASIHNGDLLRLEKQYGSEERTCAATLNDR